MTPERNGTGLPERVSVIGVTAQATFVIKKTPQGYRLFVKVDGRWRGIPGTEFDRYVRGGLRADLRVFEFDAASRRWLERRASVPLWDPEAN
jgi:hypothetical protein